MQLICFSKFHGFTQKLFFFIKKKQSSNLKFCRYEKEGMSLSVRTYNISNLIVNRKHFTIIATQQSKKCCNKLDSASGERVTVRTEPLRLIASLCSIFSISIYFFSLNIGYDFSIWIEAFLVADLYSSLIRLSLSLSLSLSLFPLSFLLSLSFSFIFPFLFSNAGIPRHSTGASRLSKWLLGGPADRVSSQQTKTNPITCFPGSGAPGRNDPEES